MRLEIAKSMLERDIFRFYSFIIQGEISINWLGSVSENVLTSIFDELAKRFHIEITIVKLF